MIHTAGEQQSPCEQDAPFAAGPHCAPALLCMSMEGFKESIIVLKKYA